MSPPQGTKTLRALLALAFLLALYATSLFQLPLQRFARVVGVHANTYSGDPLLTATPIRRPDRAYIAMDFDFRPSDMNGYPNLFQTADVNDGIRAELGNSTIGLITHRGDALHGDQIATGVEVGKWYHLKLRALNDGYVHVEISGQPVFDTWYQAEVFGATRIVLGQGFSPDRRFRGDIRNATMQVREARSPATGAKVVTILKCLWVFGFAICVLGFGKESSPVRISDSERRFYDPLLLLRAFACLLVVLGHGMMITHRADDLTDLLKAGEPAWLLTASPWAGVWVFFTLSGYLMGKGFVYGRYAPDRDGIHAFYRNRLLRIVPMYWAAVLLVSAFLYPGNFEPAGLPSFAHVLLFDQDGPDVSSPIGALWSVATEMQFYLLVPIAFLLLRRWVSSWVGIAVAMFAALAWGTAFRYGVLEYYGLDAWPREVYKTLAGNIDLFMLGFLLNCVIVKIRSFRIAHGVTIGFALVAAGYVGVAYVSAQGMLLNLPAWRSFLLEFVPTLTSIVACLVIACFELGKVRAPDLLGGVLKKAEVFGLMTYAIYVWHEPILLASAQHVGPIKDIPTALGTFAVATIVVLIVSRILYLSVEVPFERKKTRQVDVHNPNAT